MATRKAEFIAAYMEVRHKLLTNSMEVKDMTTEQRAGNALCSTATVEQAIEMAKNIATFGTDPFYVEEWKKVAALLEEALPEVTGADEAS